MDDYRLHADYLVIGGGIAGVSCVEMLTFFASGSSVVLVTATTMVKAVADISQLTKLLTTFNVVEREVDEWQKEHAGVKVVNGMVKNVDIDKKTISVENFGEIGWSKLCICTGGHPKLISDSPYVLGIRDTESVIKFQEKLGEASRVLVVGNGGIATEMVYELDNVEIVWAIKDESISSVFVDPGAGEFFIKELSKDKIEVSKPVKRMKYTVRGEGGPEVHGSALGPDWHKGFNTTGCQRGKKTHVEFQVELKQVLSREEFSASNLVQHEVDQFDKKDFNIYVELSNGKVFGCDFIVSATGVLPGGEMFKHVVNVNEDGAIVIDNTMRTSHPHNYAAEEVCSAGWNPAPDWMQMRLWKQAREMVPL